VGIKGLRTDCFRLYQSVGLKQEVDDITDDLDAKFQLEAEHHEIIDMIQHNGQHYVPTIYTDRTDRQTDRQIAS